MVRIESDLPEIELAPGVRSRPLVGDRLLASFVRYEPNSVAPLHAHAEEQVFIVVEGELEMTLGGAVRLMRAGEAALIPAWVQHTARSFDAPRLSDRRLQPAPPGDARPSQAVDVRRR